MNTYIEAQERIPNLRQQVLNKLIEAGNTGATNLQLQRICVRWNSRMGELYAQGYKIEVINESDGIYRYVLIEQPKEILKHDKAINILLSDIKNKYNDVITSKDLLHMLQENNFSVARKGGSYKL